MSEDQISQGSEQSDPTPQPADPPPRVESDSGVTPDTTRETGDPVPPDAETPVSATAATEADSEATSTVTAVAPEVDAGAPVVKAAAGTEAKESDTTVALPDKEKIPQRGAEIRGKIDRMADDQVFVDVGLRAQAVVPIGQFDNGTVPERGAEVDLLILGFDEAAELLRAYRQGSVVVPDFDALIPGMLLEGSISGMIKGGLEVQFAGLRGFMPASQVDMSPMKDISVLLGDSVRCEVLELDRRKKRIIVSRRNVQKRQSDEARKSLLGDLAVGQMHKGVVVSLAEFGAFVDIGGVRGLVHVSDLRWAPVENPADVVKVGDELEVKVLRVNKDRKRISLGHKQTIPNPWSSVDERFPVGMQIKAKVVKLADFGAFAEVVEGVNGLIPLGEMSWSHRPAAASDVVNIGDEVDVQVISVDGKRHRIGLSIKHLTEDPWAGVVEVFPAGAVVTGKVSKLLEFGALVELKVGVEGLVHISELSHQRVKTTGDVLKPGQDVEVKVLSVDRKKRRISLTIKGLTEPVADAPRASAIAKRPKRDRPLRGGLASHFEW